jgi:mannose-6-phosphate isomerase
MSNSAWVSKALFKNKPWGREVVASNHGNISAKLITIEKGHSTSFKYNNIKFETLVVLKGEIKVYYANSDFFSSNECSMKTEILEPGQALNVQCGCPYRLKALETSQLLEIGDCTNNAELNTIRIIDDYGRSSEKVTTQQKEKIIKCTQDL